MSSQLFNANPTVFAASSAPKASLYTGKNIWMEDMEEDRGAHTFADLIRNIYDPEHPNTLEELRVVSAPQIAIDRNFIDVEFTPTVPHCGMSTLIGLSIRVRLLRSLPDRYKVDIHVKPGSHQSEHTLNKQLNDKERVAAALENQALLNTVEQCLTGHGA
uniref:MIP18 family-like domain-containing protein n=1 Tax=Schizophyllum commune (strain H4-8 / FGSC 9210) TaxID=578458 RepID=D8PTG2_SCHCM